MNEKTVIEMNEVEEGVASVYGSAGSSFLPSEEEQRKANTVAAWSTFKEVVVILGIAVIGIFILNGAFFALNLALELLS